MTADADGRGDSAPRRRAAARPASSASKTRAAMSPQKLSSAVSSLGSTIIYVVERQLKSDRVAPFRFPVAASWDTWDTKCATSAIRSRQRAILRFRTPRSSCAIDTLRSIISNASSRRRAAQRRRRRGRASVTTEWVASIAASIDEIVADASSTGASSVDGANETVHAMTSDELMRATDFAWRRDRESFGRRHTRVSRRHRVWRDVRDVSHEPPASTSICRFARESSRVIHRTQTTKSGAVTPRSSPWERWRRRRYRYRYRRRPTADRRDVFITGTFLTSRPIRRARGETDQGHVRASLSARVAAPPVAAAGGSKRDVKERAENLMIVDLLRNDLARVCDVGSVDVPALAKIESYASAHQLRESRDGERLAPTSPPIGRLTRGVPTGKHDGSAQDSNDGHHRGVGKRAEDGVQRLDRVFRFRRAFDVNVVIQQRRPAGDDQWIGAGGAITVLSDPVKEWEEIELKARAILRAFASVERERSE